MTPQSPARRRFLGSTSALGALGAFGSLGALGSLGGCASATPSGTAVGAGVVRIQLGEHRIFALRDGMFERPIGEGFVRNAPLGEVQAALAAAGLSTTTLQIPFTAFLVETGNRRVLMDTGNGQFGAPTAGTLAASLQAAGIAPASINEVVITHFHGDHINGIRNREGALVYPNARIHVPTPEWNHWMDDARMNATPEAQRGGFQAARRVFGPIAASVNRFEPGREILPGITSMAAHGHTPGHTAFALSGGGRRFVYWGDLTNIEALFVRNPDWAVQFDMDADMARATRRRFMEMAVNENWVIGGYHLPFPGFGTIERSGNGYRFNAVAV